MRRLSIAALGLWLTACAASRPPATSEQKLAKRIGENAVVDGVLESRGGALCVRTEWGVVPVQPAGVVAVGPGTFVRAVGKVARGRINGGGFVASRADARGMRAAHDLVLLNAKIERHAPPATQPTTFPAGTP